jgi:hypothetical protein
MLLGYRRFILSLILAAGCVIAQDRGTISGIITDSTGAVVPSVALTLQNRATGRSQTAASTSSGGYNFVYLNVGEYTLTAKLAGFRNFEASGIRVNVDTTTRFDIQLQLGAMQETIVVSGSATMLETNTSDLGRVVENRAIQQLPLFMQGGLRSNLSFAVLTPGVNVSTASDPDTAGMTIAGGVNNGNSMLVDGAEAMSARRNDPSMRTVSSEGIEEFKVQSGAYSAEYGRTSNGVLNYTTKSGTNEYHLTAFIALRNEDLNAGGFSYIANPPPTIHRQNLEALGVGGPIFLPKLFDGRNKLFFFFAGERSRALDSGSGLASAQDTITGLLTLPTQAFRNGDFSQLVNAQGAVIPLYDPLDANGNLLPSGSQRQRLQCNGVLNVICPNRIAPVAQYIQSLLPLPDNPGMMYNNTTSRSNGNRVPGADQGVYSLKLDYNPTDKLRFNGLLSKQYYGSYPLVGPVPGVLGSAWQETGHSNWARFNADYIIRPNVIDHFTFGYLNRRITEQSNLNMGLPPDYRQKTLIPGIPASSTSAAANVTEYQFADWGNYGLGSFVSTNSPSNTDSFNDQMAWLKGRHNMRMGFDAANISYTRLSCNSCDGTVSFAAAATGNPSVSGVNGYSYASFLLGAATSGNFFYAANITFNFRYYAWYWQDDIRVSNRLTVNVGMRYDLPFPRDEPNHENSNFNPSLPNPGAGGLLGALEFAGSGPGRSGKERLYQTRKNAFGPRLGFAYKLDSKTVIRAGGAIMYDSNREDDNADSNIQGFGGSFSAPANYLSDGISFTLQNGFNTFPQLVQAGLPVQINPSLANFTTPSYKAGEAGRVAYFTDYNFTVERSLSDSTLLRAGFHANYGQHLLSSQNFNQLDPKYLSIYGNLLSSPLSAVINDPTVIAAGFKLPYAAYPLTQQLQQALRPFPQYVGNISGTTVGGHSTYNALETSLQHRFSKGLYMGITYTFSKLMGNQTSENVYLYNVQKSVTSSDRPHVFVVSYIYDLPIGKGKAFLKNMNPVLNAFIGNWTIAGMQRYQSGGPIGVSASQNMFGAGTSRASFVPGQPLLNPNWNRSNPSSQYINSAAFYQPSNMVYGNTPAYIAQLRLPFQLDEDVAVSKNIFLGSEKRKLELRGSAFNVANRHLFGSLVSNVSSSTFGTFTSPQSNQPRSVEMSLRLSF